jgi:metal-sulfur cluster biosynthetic enzyme
MSTSVLGRPLEAAASAVTSVPGTSVDSAESAVTPILAALDNVMDPELDESLVRLGFVDAVSVEGAAVRLVLRLPTFWCSPNFAYLMASDARQRALELPGVQRVEVMLKDHAHASEISAGASEGRSFAEVFPDEAGGDLDELRARFRRKAFGMRQEQLVRFLLDAGLTPHDVVALRVGDDRRMPRGGAPLLRAYLEKRAQLGLSGDPDAALITDESGGAIAADDLLAYVRQVRRQRISMAMNTALCTGLLAVRYGEESVDRLDGSPAHVRATH